MNQLIKKEFETKIGQIECQLISDQSTLILIGREKYENGELNKYETEGYQIELIEFTSRSHELVKDSKCWIFRITKTNKKKEKLKIRCELMKYIKDVQFDTASGENLDAIEASNQEWQVHIGTEDGETMNSRAERNDWFPERLKKKVNFDESITSYLKEYSGLQTKIPTLKENEKIHIQYLSAIDLKNDENINCWNAVDDLKRDLENWIGI